MASAKGRPPPPRLPFFPRPGSAGRLRFAGTVWAAPRSLAATRGILSSPEGTEMFQFPPCPPIIRWAPGHHAGRVAPFGNPWIAGCQHLPRALRRVAASFIGRQRQGIHRAPIFAISHSHARSFGVQPAAGRAPSLPRGTIRASRRRPIATSRSRGHDARLERLAAPAGSGNPARHQLSRCPRGRRRGAAGIRTPDLRRAKAALSLAKLRPRRTPRATILRRRWARLDSNQGPRPYQGRALTS